jgi:hypothetical protein
MSTTAGAGDIIDMTIPNPKSKRAMELTLTEWRDYQHLVLHELTRLNNNIEGLVRRQDDFAEKQAAQDLAINTIRTESQTKAKMAGTIFGLLSGFSASLVLVIIEYVLSNQK